MSDGWSKPTSDAATAIGARALAMLVEHGGPVDLRLATLISRACALAADEAIHELDADNAKLRRWRDALIDAAVVSWTYTAEQEENPKALINALLCQVQAEALDPAISKEARDLIERGRAEAGAAPGPEYIEDVDP